MLEEKKYSKVPEAKNKNSVAEQFEAYVELVRILRRECPWDKKQTNQSIAPLMIEEAYEVITAIHKNSDEDFAKELGDVLLHIVMHALMAEERGAFNMIDVLKKNTAKLVHRHPHVFGSVNAETEEQVLKNWEELKMQEGQKSILDGVPPAMPALLRAERVQHKAAKVGFDWTEEADVWDKVDEELAELREEIKNHDKEKATEEFGDFLFALVNAARFRGIVAEDALMKTNEKFTRRFQYIEQKANENGKKLKEMTLEEMDKWWDEAKSKE